MSGSIGGVDASIPLQAGKGVTPAANPLAMVGQYANAINALNQTKLFPGQQQLQQQAIQGGALGLAQKTNQAVYAGLVPYINDPSLNHDKLTTALASIEASGIPTGGVIARLSKALPGGDGPDFQQAVRSLVGTGALTNSAEQLQANVGSPTVMGTGQVNQPGMMGGVLSPTPGAFTPQGAGVQQVTPPGTNADLVAITNPDGSKQLVPRSALPGASGVPGQSAGAPTPSPTNPPRLPGVATAQAGQPSTTVALPIGTPESIAADVGTFKKDQFALPQVQQNVQSLQKAQEALELADTGRSTESVHNIYSFLNAQGIQIPGVSGDSDVSSYDIAHKYLIDYARKQGAAAHSDLQLQTAEGANASTGISNAAALNVVKTNIGRERQSIAQNMTAAPTGIGYGAHTSKFSNSTDPRGFAIDSYSPAELAKIESSLKTPEQKAKFYRAAGIAARLGLLNPQSAPAPAAPAALAPQAPAALPPGATTTLNPGPGGA